MNTSTNEALTLKINSRSQTGKSAAFRARLESKVPAVVYGPKLKTPFTVAVHPNELVSLYKKAGHTGLVTLESTDDAAKELNGTKVLIKEIQVHPYKNRVMHVDLHQLDLTKALRVTVPLNFVGKAKGVAEGGLLSIVTRQVEIKVRPQDIPNHIDVDISEVGLNDSIHVEELSKKFSGGKFEFIYETDYVLISCVPPEAEEVAAPAAAAAGTEGAAASAAGGAAPAAAGAAAPGGAKAATPAAAPAAAAKAPAKK